MKTKPLYLEDSYLQETEASIIAALPIKDREYQIILDQTVFYPMGGGQRTDQGTLEAGAWQGNVYQVLFQADEIVHYVQTDAPPKIGEHVKARIDWKRRYHQMRLHSAGHIVDFALHLLGHSPQVLAPLKADHGKKPYIVYQGSLQEDIREKLQAKSNELVQKDLTFKTEFVNYEELKNHCIYLQPGLPQNKPLRMLTLEEVGSVADGGTQVRKTSETGMIEIPKIELKGGETVIHYRIEG